NEDGPDNEDEDEQQTPPPDNQTLLREVHKRRYLLQPIALEVFSSDGRNYLLAFPRKVRNKVYSRFTALATGMADSAAGSVAGQKRGVAVEQPGGLLASLIGDTSVTQRWLRGEISNFQYLMHLNTLAGRSYNDLMQYPVFPWILADYDSLELDLNDPATFRDLTKPMGAQSWNSASRHNMADVKELIPEFFYLPEFLVNSNNFDLGHKQSGVALGDIVLPPWARGDPREFIRLHRAALESDFVSHRLHHWIDLVFGYKQQGQAAVDSCNQSGVALGDIVLPPWARGDPREFIRLHRAALESDFVSHRLHHWIDLVFGYKQQGQAAVDSCNVIDDPLKKNATIVEQNKVLMPPAYNKYVAWGFADHSLRIGNYDNDKAVFVCETVAQACGEIVTCVCPSAKTIVTAGTSTVVTVWQYWARRRRLAVKVCLYGHEEAVTCLAASPAYNLVVSGGRDGQLIVWDVERGAFVRQLVPARLASPQPPVSALAIDDLTLLGAVDTAGGRERTQQVLCVAFSQTREWDPLNVIMTGSTDGVVRRSQQVLCVAFSQTREWDPLNVIMTGSTDGVVRRSQQVLCVAFSQTREWDPLNVIMTGSTDGVVRRSQQVLCVAFSQTTEWDPLSDIMIGSTDGVVRACETSAKESAQRHDEKDTCSDNEEPQYLQNDVTEPPNDDVIESCDEAGPECDNEKDIDTEKDDLRTHSKLQKQGNVVLRRKSKCNPLYRKSK
ncbi:Uncharacterized protein OBRU01_10878, partial [Operophtera brumata]